MAGVSGAVNHITSLYYDLRYYEMMDVLKSADEQITYYYSRNLEQ
jgi:hypothetical protein